MTPISKLPKSTGPATEKATSDSPAQSDNTTRYSFSSDSDDDENDPPERVWHDDHWDRLVEGNIWNSDSNEWAWYSSWVERGSRNKTNAQHDQEPATQEWLKRVPVLEKGTIVALAPRAGPTAPSVPLFIGENGDEYHIFLTFAFGTYSPSLPHIWCPALLGSMQNGSLVYFELRARQSVAKVESGTPVFNFPKYCLSIGQLRVRTSARSNFPAFRDGPLTETTDFDVIVDLQHDDLPLWIVAHRQQLLTRPKTGGSAVRPPLLPIFDGLMTTSDHDPYDIACILPSIRQLANRRPGAEPPSYAETCELVRKTRAMIDPISFVPHKADMEKFIHDKEAPEHMPPKLTGIHGGLSKLWTYFRGNR